MIHLMSIRNRINIETPETPFALTQSEAARCAIDQHGEIVYATDAFYQLCDLAAEDKNYVHDVFMFSEDILNDEDDISSLESGSHDVHIKGNPILTEFQFDWLTGHENKKYLIASAASDGTSINLQDELDVLMHEIQRSTARLHRKNDNIIDMNPTTDDFAEFVSLTNDIMIITDEEGKIITANDTFLNTYGYDAGKVKYETFTEFFYEEDKHAVRSTMLGLIQDQSHGQNSTARFEARLITSDGQARWVKWKKKYAHGKIYISGQDITGIKKQQQNLNRRQRQLSEAEAIGRMGHWQWLIGEDHISWSEEIFRIFGVDQNQFEPSIHTLTELVHKRDLGRVVQVFQRAIIEEKNYDMEFRIIRPGGDVRFIMLEGRCEKDESGEVIALYGIMQDMTERMLYEQELRQARDASEQAYAAKTRFLANMSHELRTPLNAIIGFSEMIESEMLGPIDNNKYVEYATSIKDSGRHLLDLISDILDMSKIEAGKHSLDLGEVHVQDIIDRASHMVSGRAQEKNITLETANVENAEIDIIGDRRALTQIMLNLLSNAVKFTPENGTVWVECYKRESYLSIKVCDNGIGIPPNKLASVLRPFEQVSSEYTRDHEGTGLGLSITKKLIELHNGVLFIESTMDSGTTATVRLPYDAQRID